MSSFAAANMNQIVAFLTLNDAQGKEIERWKLANKNTYRIGRSEGNDIILPFSWVSRKHAMVQVEENGVHNLIDLGSANGTMVNNRRIYTPTPLNPGDVVGVGKTQLVFSQDISFLGKPTIDETELYDNQTVAFVEKEIVTVLLCDIHGFTHLSEQLGDQKISMLLQQWSDQVTKLVFEHGGMVDKFIGDAVMAIWVGGSDQRGAILSAMKAAISIKDLTRTMGEKWPETPLKLEIGGALNTGVAALGNMGGGGRRDYTVVGDMVNVAFRLEGMTSQKDGIDFVVGCEAVSYLEGVNSCFTSRTFSLKGKEAPIKAFVCSFPQLSNYLAQYHKTR